MKVAASLCVLAFYSSVAVSQESPRIAPERFVIGSHTFIDVGPPNDFYEVFLVGPNATGASIERMTLTPAGDACLLPAKVETAAASIGESPAQLLKMQNPCTIPERELRSEMKRCKHCLIFSGANISVQVQCGHETRIIRSDGNATFGSTAVFLRQDAPQSLESCRYSLSEKDPLFADDSEPGRSRATHPCSAYSF